MKYDFRLCKAYFKRQKQVRNYKLVKVVLPFKKNLSHIKKIKSFLQEWKFKSLLNKHLSLFCLHISFANTKCEGQYISWLCLGSLKKVKMSRGLINTSNPLTVFFCVSISLHPSCWSRGESFLIKFMRPFGLTCFYFLLLRFKTEHTCITTASSVSILYRFLTYF